MGLPGVKFGWFGIRASRKCKKAGCDDLAYGLSINPVSCVRYFEFDFARRMLPRNLKGRCLDVSSPRLFSAYMLAQNPDLQMDIINPDTSDLEETGDLLRSLGISSERYGLHNIYADKLPWEDRAFDYIWSISVIEHIPEQQDIITLKEIERVLKFNGLLLLTFPVAGKSQDEFREEDVYGLNKVQKDEERVFFQRWYDDSMQRDRIVSQLEKMEIIAQEIWCERQADWLENYFVNYRKNGLKTASWDPVYMLKYFKRCFAMQGELFAGIKCVCFRKMKSGDMA